MIRLAASALLLLVGASHDQPNRKQPRAYELAALQVVVRQQIIVRVPAPRGGVPASATPFHWRESNGPRCISAAQVAGAAPSQNSVDFIMRDNSRVRAQLGQRCAALDYYRGFYVNATPDGRICADRDSIRSRIGGQCDIAEFHTLRPGRP